MFNNTVKVEWLEHDPRKMRLLETVIFTDKQNTTWQASAGAIIDGASIPRLCWRIIGTPFVGKYRRASVIHDVHCVLKSRSPRCVHNMFYQAMLADGVPKLKAKVMYYAVCIGGPKWPLN